MATRRDFLKMGSLAAVAGLTPALAGKALARTSEGFFEIPAASNSSFYTGKTFEPFLNEIFRFSSKMVKRPVLLKLVELNEKISKPHRPLGVRAKSCSMIFKGGNGTKLPQDTYQVNHKTLGKFSALLVPISNDSNTYEVIFNRI